MVTAAAANTGAVVPVVTGGNIAGNTGRAGGAGGVGQGSSVAGMGGSTRALSASASAPAIASPTAMSPKEARRASGSAVLAPAVSGEVSSGQQQQAPPTPSAESVDEAAALIETLLEDPKRKRRYRKSQPQA